MSDKVHTCCGCSCARCEGGHATGGDAHSVECISRFLGEVDPTTREAVRSTECAAGAHWWGNWQFAPSNPVTGERLHVDPIGGTYSDLANTAARYRRECQRCSAVQLVRELSPPPGMDVIVRHVKP